MVRDFMTAAEDFLGDGGEAADISAAHEEGGADTEAVEEVEQIDGGFAGAIIEGEGEAFAVGVAAVDAGGEPVAAGGADGIGHPGAGEREGGERVAEQFGHHGSFLFCTQPAGGVRRGW